MSDATIEAADTGWPGTGRPVCPDSVRVRGDEASIPIDIIYLVDEPCKSVLSLADGTSSSINCFMRDHAHIWRGLFDQLWARLIETEVDPLIISVARDPEQFAPRNRFAARFIPIRLGNISGFVGDPFLRLLSGIRWLRGSLRPNATTHIVLLTDGYLSLDVHYTAEEFLALTRDLIGEVQVHAISSPQLPLTPQNPNGVCSTSRGSASYASPWYAEAARNSGGISQDICSDDWTPLIEALTERIVVREPIPCAVTLPRIPPPGYRYRPEDFVVRATSDEVPDWILERTDEGCPDGGDGWWFTPIANHVHLCPSSCATVEAFDAAIEVDLACAG